MRTSRDRLLRWFADEQVAFVTAAQRFDVDVDVLNNRQPFFHHCLQPAKDAAGCAISCGSGVIYRRVALDDVNGFSEWNIVEDLHTSYRLHAAGWTSVYEREPVTTGLAPNTAAEYAHQRARWMVDGLRLLLLDSPLRRRGLSLRARLHYLHTAGSYLLGLPLLLFLALPPLYLLLRVPAAGPATGLQYLSNAVPVPRPPGRLLRLARRCSRGPARVPQRRSSTPGSCRSRSPEPVRRPRRGGVTKKSGQRRVTWLLLPQIVVGRAPRARLGDGDHRRATWDLGHRRDLGGAAGVAPRRPAHRVVRAGAHRTTHECGRPTRRRRRLGSPPSPERRPSPPDPLADTPRVDPAAGAAERFIVPAPDDTCSDDRCGDSDRARLPPSSAHPPRSQRPRPRPFLPVRRCSPSRSTVPTSASPTRACTRRSGGVEDWSRAHAGARPAIVHWFQQWGSGENRFREDWVRHVAAQGAVPMISWEPWAKPVGEYARSRAAGLPPATDHRRRVRHLHPVVGAGGGRRTASRSSSASCTSSTVTGTRGRSA